MNPEYQFSFVESFWPRFLCDDDQCVFCSFVDWFKTKIHETLIDVGMRALACESFSAAWHCITFNLTFFTHKHAHSQFISII